MGVVRDVHRWVPISLFRLLGEGGTARGRIDRLPTPRLRLHQPPQPRAGALGDLAVLLVRPAEALAELGAAHAERYLTGEHQPLVGCEEGREPRDLAQLVAVGDERVDLGAGVGELQFPLAQATPRERALQVGLQRAAAAHRAAAVLYAREEALLERVGDVLAAGEAVTASTAGEQLEDGLAETILQVLAPQHVVVGAQHRLAPCARDERDLLGRVATPSALQLLGRSGRHTGMSHLVAGRPPSQ